MLSLPVASGAVDLKFNLNPVNNPKAQNSQKTLHDVVV